MGDMIQARKLLSWIKELDSKLNHELLLVASSKVPTEDIVSTNNICSGVFTKVTSVRATIINEGHWPKSANDMFRSAHQWAKRNNKPFYLWAEPDVCPTVPGWLDILEREYQRSGKALMGVVHNYPFRHMNGVAIWNTNFPRFNPQVLGAQNLPFDCVRPELNIRQCHNTQLIWRKLEDPSKNLSLTFPNQESLRSIPEAAVLTHCCKDGSIIDRLRERNGFKTHVLPEVVSTKSWIGRRIQSLKKTTKKTTYYHSGNLGDIIYALCAIKLSGGGDLIIGPQQRGTTPCSNPINQSQFNLLKPLLESQSYIGSVQFSPEYPKCDTDLNKFRNNWFNLDLRLETKVNSLCAAHCQLLGVLDQFKEKDPWMTLQAPSNDRLIIARSLRHRNWDLDYSVLEGLDCWFIGLEQEAMIYQICWPKVEHKQTVNFLDMAQVIAGSRGMAGNQSFPMALALALGVPVLQETFSPAPDCIFQRKNFFRQGQEQKFVRLVT